MNFILATAEGWTPSDVVTIIITLANAVVAIIAALKANTAQVQSQATADSLSRMSSRLTQTQGEVTQVALQQTPLKQGTADATPTDKF